MSLIKELRRRNIFRVAVLYIASGWLVLQLAELFISLAGSGDWIYRFMFGLGVICLPLMLVFSYLYEITPEGLRKEHLVAREESVTRRTGRKIARATWLVIALALLLELLLWLMN